jgi:hypothetical protein
LTASFESFDQWWANARCSPELTQYGWDYSGSTAVVGMVSKDQLVVANADGCTAHFMTFAAIRLVSSIATALLMQNLLAVNPRL